MSGFPFEVFASGPLKFPTFNMPLVWSLRSYVTKTFDLVPHQFLTLQVFPQIQVYQKQFRKSHT